MALVIMAQGVVLTLLLFVLYMVILVAMLMVSWMSLYNEACQETSYIMIVGLKSQLNVKL